MSEYDAVLKNARFEMGDKQSPNIVGQIYDDKKGRFADGTQVYTSTLQDHLPGGIFVTRNTRYLVHFAPEYLPPRRLTHPKEPEPMSETVKTDGGPAFPRSDAGYSVTQDGMSLRDWLAGQAITSVGSSIQAPPGVGLEGVCAEIARVSYMVADAMLEARALSLANKDT